MKVLSLLILSTLLFVNSFNSSQEPPELQEADKLNESAVKLYNQGKFHEALPLAKRALEIRDKLLPRTDPRISSSLTNLGEIYIAQKDYKPAREVFQRLLQIQEEVFGPEDVNLAFIRKQFSGADSVDTEPVTVLNGRALSLPQPEYPAARAQRRLSGTVIVKVQIDESGAVIEAADICKGPLFLSEAAVAAARKARFSPTKINGQPIKIGGVIQYNFTRRFR